jgi:hypothetical protein
MGGALLIAVLISAGTLAYLGIGEKGTYTAIRITARWSYAFFWPAYTGGPLALLFGPRFQPVARRGRELGLAFAAAHLAHVALVAWLYHIATKPPIPTSAAIFFGIALGFTYLIALLSIPRLAALLPRWLWRTIVLVGMEIIALAFLRDFLRYPFGHGIARVLFMLPFSVLAVAAALLRIASYGMKLRLGLRQSRAIPL